ncbi:MAG: ribosome biogenesis GTPase YlqF [Desulfuromonadales bacterium]|nr:ribosome biogenesis GTPase YlqF [Desulfuromonadales bacterium]
MAIEWYPGHMSKARREIAEVIQGFDVVIEVLDARLPASSANPVLQELRRDKPWIKILNKHDLADPAVTKEWVRHLEQHSGVRALPLQAKNRQETGMIAKLCRRLAPHRAKPGKPLRAMIIGIPNVGKSTLINTLAGKRMARVGDKPAITTCQQQIDLRNGIFLHDTPGLLWPDMRNQTHAYRLAASGAIGENALDYTDVALFAATFMAERYPQQIAARYRLESLPETATAILEEIGRRRGCLATGGDIDLHRTAELFLRELRAGLLGRISFEGPGEEFADPLADDSETLASPLPPADPTEP